MNQYQYLFIALPVKCVLGISFILSQNSGMIILPAYFAKGYEAVFNAENASIRGFERKSSVFCQFLGYY